MSRRGNITRQTTGNNPISTMMSDPRARFPDLDKEIRKLLPTATPMQFLTEKFSRRGPRPKSYIVEYKKMRTYDSLNFASDYSLGTGQYTRYAAIDISNTDVTRPDGPIFAPQDVVKIVDTMQSAEVVMTETGSLIESGVALQLPAALAGVVGTGLVSACKPGRIIVRNVEPAAMRAASSTTGVYNLGRTLYESQDIGGPSQFGYAIYDANYVEHKEKIISCTEDEYSLIEYEDKTQTFVERKAEMLRVFKEEVEHTLFFGTRSVNYSEIQGGTRRGKYYMGGLLDTIETNITLYNPNTTTNFEHMIQNWMIQQVFRHNPNGYRRVIHAGVNALRDFQREFEEIRRISLSNGKEGPMLNGLRIDQYDYLNFTINMVRNDILRPNTPLQHWMIAIDPDEPISRIVKNYETKDPTLPNQRRKALMVEWQGTMQWNREELYSVLRTAG